MKNKDNSVITSMLTSFFVKELISTSRSNFSNAFIHEDEFIFVLIFNSSAITRIPLSLIIYNQIKSKYFKKNKIYRKVVGNITENSS